jgi:hypothetical protein
LAAELEPLLREDPDAAAEFRTLLAQIDTNLPANLRASVQSNVASDGGRVLAVHGGNMVAHDPAAPLAPAASKDISPSDGAG